MLTLIVIEISTDLAYSLPILWLLLNWSEHEKNTFLTLLGLTSLFYLMLYTTTQSLNLSGFTGKEEKKD